MLKKFFKKNILLILILVIAAFFRFYHLSDYMEFLGDQGRDVTIIRDFLQKGNLFFIGPQTSIGNMYLGPYFYYLISPSLFLSNYNPIGPAIFIALISLATVFLLYHVGNAWFNKNTGLIAAFLFSISPVVIKYSNFIWNPNIMPFFSLLFVFLFFEALIKENYKYFVWSTLAFVMVINSHYLGLALLPFIGIYWVLQLIKYLKFKSSKIKPYILFTLLSLFVFLISLIPQILFDIKHNGQNFNALVGFFTHRETTVNIKAYKAIPYLAPLYNQVNTRLLAGKNEIAGIILSVVFFIGLIYLFLKSNKKQQKFYHLSFFWYLSGLVCLALYKQHIYDHYFGFLFPIVFLLIAYLINRLKWFGIPLFIFITIFSFIESPLRWSPPKQYTTTNQISDLIISNSNNNNFNFALLAKMNYDPPYRYLLTQKQAKLYDVHDQITEQLFVVCEPFQIDCNPINNPQWEVASFGWAKIESQWEINGIKIFKLVHNKL